MCMTITTKYIDPFTDFGFKKIFGTEENKDLLISFLNDLLNINSPIKDIKYRNLEKLGLNPLDRKAIFDIYCTDENGDNFIVELQRSPQKYFMDRSFYYMSFPIQEQSKRGDWDYRLKGVYFVGILDFNMSLDEEYLTEIKPMNTRTKEVAYDKFSIYYIEMPKFKKQEKELSSHLDKWLYYLNNLTTFDDIPQVLEDDEYIKRAFEVAEFLNLPKDEQFSYQSDLKSRLDYKNSMDFAKESAKEQGKLEGRIEGKLEGIKEGRIEIAKNLLDVLDVETISKKTNLSIDEINSLKE